MTQRMTARTGLLPTVTTVFIILAASGALPAAVGIGWDNLRPADQKADLRIMPAEAPDIGRQLSTTLDGETVEITGFLLPSDREGSLVYEFMLVPMAGACSHDAQPAPNQVVRVTPAEPFKATTSYQLVTVTGTLDAGFDKTQLFILDGVRVVESGYRIGSATVEARNDDTPSPGTGNPWRFLKR